ncbi:MAG: epoxyqueuosine reductase QueH [Bacilli bacterium]|nr:epoxyqueuosine reductase QueH [Bacilli bacterium]
MMLANMIYQIVLDEILKQINLSGKTPKLLLHACCAPCSSYVLEYLSEFFEITIYYYNPNIHPENEYIRRLNELRKFLTEFKSKNKINLVEEIYNPLEYFNEVKGLENLGEKSKRCYKCYKLRMEKAVEYAKNNNFDYFTTTLSISPYKKSDWINEIGGMLENKYNIKYLYADFKKKNGYKRSLELSKEYGLYRQDYCGCIYSKQEREIIV